MSERLNRKERERPTAGSKSDGGSKYDPQVGAAAKANAAISAEALAFSKQYFTDYVAPSLEQMTAASQQTQAQQGELFDFNMAQMQEASDRYHQYGIPAENRYYDMVNKYSEPEEMERQATLALGDYRQAAENQRGTVSRQQTAMGIDPTSPAAEAARNAMAVANTAGEAGAMNRARGAARSLGIALTSDAANFGRGGTSATMGFGQMASGNSMNGVNAAGMGLNGMNSGAGVVQGGQQIAQRGYSANLSAYTDLARADMAAQAQADAGMGQFIGSVVAGGAQMMMGMPPTAMMGGGTSDIRAKQNIRYVGRLPNNIPIYAFEYKEEHRAESGHGVRYGPMAQDLLKVLPAAVTIRADGLYTVNYDMVMEFGA